MLKTTPILNETQMSALAALQRNPDAQAVGIESATLAFLRRHGLVGREVLTFTRGPKVRQKTLSPITAAGEEALYRAPLARYR